MRVFLVAAALACGACRGAPMTPPSQAMPNTTTTSTTPSPEPTGAAARPVIDEAILEQQAATQGFRLGRPGNIRVTPDGTAVLFTRTPPRSRVADLYSFDVATGQTRKLVAAAEVLAGGAETLSDEEKARRERARKSNRGVAGYELSDDGKHVLVTLGGRPYLVERQAGKITPLPAGPGAAIDARFSPDGARVALVRDGDLYVLDLARGDEKRLTTRPSRDVEHAVAEFVAQEEMKRFKGYWWAPDGQSIVYQRNDASKMDTLHVVDPAHPERAPVAFRYPRVGTANADVRLGVISVKGGRTTWLHWDRERFPYVAQVAWEKNAPLTVVVQNRRQTELAVLAVDAKLGTTTELLREEDPAWLDLDRAMPRWLPDGSGFLWSTERDGRWKVELRKRDGSLAHVVVPPEVGYESFGGIDEERGELWFSGSPDARQSQVWRVPLAGGAAPEQVTKVDGVHDATISKRGGTAVVSSSLRDGKSSSEVRRRDGGVAGVLESVAEQPPYQANTEWTEVEVEGRTFPAAIIRPRDFQPGRKYPVIAAVYGGPTSLVVKLTGEKYISDQVYADAGFIVVRADGRGTPRRGRDWERAVDKDLISVCLETRPRSSRRSAGVIPRWISRAWASWDGRSAATWRSWPCSCAPTSFTRRSRARRSPTGVSTTRTTPSVTWGCSTRTARATRPRAPSRTPPSSRARCCSSTAPPTTTSTSPTPCSSSTRCSARARASSSCRSRASRTWFPIRW